jgi:hypothetical protein
MTALSIARCVEERIAALRVLSMAAENELDRLVQTAPDWSCHACRRTWVGGTVPVPMVCDCGQALQCHVPRLVVGTDAKPSTERGSWKCSGCGFRGFWSGGVHCLGVAA